MGINARLEDRCGHMIEEVVDANGYVNWLLSLDAEGNDSCVRGIDPYGQTVFNILQIDQLERQLNKLRQHITDRDLAVSKRAYLASFGGVSADMMAEVIRGVDKISTSNLIEHLAKLLALISVAKTIGPHHYLRFIGD